MSETFLTSCVATLSKIPPVTGVLAAFAFGYLAIGFPMHSRAGGAARDVWGTVAGLCVAALYAFLIAEVFPYASHYTHLAPMVTSNAR
jgi:hypothetical protein